MAKCDLSIELDDPNQMHSGGGKISGKVRVDVDANVKCSGLVVSSVWRTHGRGNVASGDCGMQVLFEGEWTAGEKLEYRFELPISHWPPSYHGHYLNIDHYIDARAKIPWSFDPKDSVPFLMRPTCGAGEIVSQSNAIEATGIVKFILGLVMVGMLIGCAFLVTQFGLFGLIFLAIPLAGFLYWFFSKFLPKYALGDVLAHVEQRQVSPGDTIIGDLIITPRKTVSINGVTFTLQAREQCVSGSGSNRTTHRKVFFDQLFTLQDATSLTPGQEHRYPFSVQVPSDAPYSIDLDDNDLIWDATLRVDIPRWPDWTQDIQLEVVPSGKQAAVVATVADDVTPVPAQPASTSTGEITFRETAEHLMSLRGDREQLGTLTEAVTGMTFDIEAVVERRLLYSGDDDPHVYPDGYAVWAHFPDPELPMVLYVPHEMADEFEHMGQDVCRGKGKIVGWDHLHGRLQVKLERTA